jgi:hypothetical protein
MDGKALLGPLPKPFDHMHVVDPPGSPLKPTWAYLNQKTGKLQTVDPRLGPLPRAWSSSARDNEARETFRNHETREETIWDPRLSSEELRKRGVSVQVFDLV